MGGEVFRILSLKGRRGRREGGKRGRRVLSGLQGVTVTMGFMGEKILSVRLSDL